MRQALKLARSALQCHTACICEMPMALWSDNICLRMWCSLGCAVINIIHHTHIRLPHHARPNILTAMLQKIHIFYDVSLCCWASSSQCYEVSQSLILRVLQPKTKPWRRRHYNLSKCRELISWQQCHMPCGLNLHAPCMTDFKAGLMYCNTIY
jgi:hypothetical protein